MQAPGSSILALALLGSLLAWRVYSRLKQSIGRQRLSPIRLRITLTVFPLLLILFAYSARGRLDLLAWLAGAATLGASLGVYGLRHTRFEPTQQGLFYTPSAHIGIALSLLFVGRLVYRLVEVYALDPTTVRSGAEFARSPLTLAVFGLLSGYYISYAIGLMRWRTRVLEAKKDRETKARQSTMPTTDPDHR